MYLTPTLKIGIFEMQPSGLNKNSQIKELQFQNPRGETQRNIPTADNFSSPADSCTLRAEGTINNDGEQYHPHSRVASISWEPLPAKYANLEEPLCAVCFSVGKDKCGNNLASPGLYHHYNRRRGGVFHSSLLIDEIGGFIRGAFSHSSPGPCLMHCLEIIGQLEGTKLRSIKYTAHVTLLNHDTGPQRIYPTPERKLELVILPSHDADSHQHHPARRTVRITYQATD
ncbi:hypothetical protein J6590_011579 [Homalodisca vitripennis]|nr:hypothetical protein J6590_011579 [Homalodisca vitripennis]